MRHNSERVPGKNYREIAGKPLYAHILETLLSVPEITTVVVDTDSPVIMDGLKKNYPTVMRLQRPDHLIDGHISMNTILLHNTKQVQADYYLQTHSTNPVLRADTIQKAVRTFLESCTEKQYDSLFSVTRLQTRLYDKDGKPINHDTNKLLRTQDLPPVYEENSCIYIFDRNTLERRQNRIGDQPIMFEIPATEALDIDEELDFVFTSFVLDQQRQRKE